jgi:hypothetical protein
VALGDVVALRDVVALGEVVAVRRCGSSAITFIVLYYYCTSFQNICCAYVLFTVKLSYSTNYNRSKFLPLGKFVDL